MFVLSFESEVSFALNVCWFKGLSCRYFLYRIVDERTDVNVYSAMFRAKGVENFSSIFFKKNSKAFFVGRI